MGTRAREVALGGDEQLFALAGALGGEVGIAADHQSLAGEFAAGDAGHVALVEQRELHGAALQQRLDRRCAQGRNPVQACRLDVAADARLGAGTPTRSRVGNPLHAAVADQHHVI
jgi:hypothetical protein